MGRKTTKDTAFPGPERTARHRGIPAQVVETWQLANVERYFALADERIAAMAADLAARRALALAWQERPELQLVCDVVEADEHQTFLAELVTRQEAAARALDDIERGMIAEGYLGEFEGTIHFYNAGNEVLIVPTDV